MKKKFFVVFDKETKRFMVGTDRTCFISFGMNTNYHKGKLNQWNLVYGVNQING